VIFFVRVQPEIADVKKSAGIIKYFLQVLF